MQLTEEQEVLLQNNNDEYKKCQDDPCYFYNKYMKPKHLPELSEEVFSEYKKEIDFYRNNRLTGLKNRKGQYMFVPLIHSECFTKQ